MVPQQDDFQQLRRLLALKRYEQPPPGYFNQFSRNVMARIRAGEHRLEHSSVEDWFAQVPWLRRFWSMLETKPVFAGAFGLGVCAVLLGGLVYSSMDSHPPVTGISVINEPSANQAIAVSTPTAPNVAFQSGTTGGVVALPPGESLFEQFRNGQNPNLFIERANKQGVSP
ncbi:MAG TPA: hypothetical protein PKX23_08130 [Verrucomicrobiota bacterium]|mgnify:CR=1 FL=1|jgi:hypothetical protein|nr:hypothetical protein [Verrucomicrobiota bacterium]HRT07080.1 hypothetical protein [Candidatus Paceibacterota bacterium]